MIKAVIFDLDGVIVSTDECHFKAWKAMAEQEGIPFSREDNHRLRGVSRMESLGIVLEKADRPYSDAERKYLAEIKNALYVQLIMEIQASDLLPGAKETVDRLREMGIKTAIGSSSKNAPLILDRLGITQDFDAIADGNGIKNSKPAPDVFLLASEMLDIAPEYCLVVEDADAGIDAAINAGMISLGVGAAQHYEKATIRANSLADFDLPAWVKAHNQKL